MEIFKLCKKLHELMPDWRTSGSHVIKFKGDESRVYHDNVHRTGYDWAPEYTLEYLLNKLPKTIDGDSDCGILTLTIDEVEYEGSWTWGWRAFYETCNGCSADDLFCEAVTPLHAVLKLAIAMAEKGLV